MLKSESHEEMVQVAVQSGMKILLADGGGKAVAGETSIAEVLRVTDKTL